MRKKGARPLIFAAVLAIAAGAAVAAVGQTSPPPSGTLTFKELDKGSKFAFIDNPPRSKRKGEPSASIGDDLTFGNPLVDGAGKRIGTLYVHCTIVRGSRRILNASTLCNGAYAFAGQGTLTIEALAAPISAKTVTGTITGGTGKFANARGTFQSTSTKTGSDDTVTFAG